MSTGAKMPRYQSIKKVWALQIHTKDGNTLHFVDERYAKKECDPALFSRYIPVPGDYYVVYEDGYESISPRKAFEEGYVAL